MSAKRLTRIYSHRAMYLLLLPGIVYYLLFHYLPMTGVVLAFKEFQFGKFQRITDIFRIWTFPDVGLENFRLIFESPTFRSVLVNTVKISLGRLLFEFPIPILLALFLNEIQNTRLKRSFQTTLTFPHFLSWVVVVTILNSLLRNDGLINKAIAGFGGTEVNFLTNRDAFLPLLFITSNWKEAGWGTVLYLATMAGINPELYEAARVDGANRFHAMRYVTFPSIRPTVVLMLIMACSNILNAGFDQIFNMYNQVVLPVADIIDTYIYRTTFTQGTNYSLNTAIGLFKSVIGFVLILSVDRIAKGLGESGLF